MVRILVLMFLLVNLTLSIDLFGQRQLPSQVFQPGRQYICYGSDEVRDIYIPPPHAFRTGKGSGSANIEVTYIGFSDEAKNAFAYAVDIWSSMITSGVKIRIRAQWISMAEEGVLGSASATSYFKGSFIEALFPDVYYPVSLAEKISGRELNAPTEYDISVRFNSGADWYYETDGSTPSTKHDLVTVVLHELCHGLGFADSFNTTETTGSYGLSGLPVIYDTFIENPQGKRLTDTASFTNPSAALRSALIGGSLYFNGTVTANYTGGTRPPLYAPGIWDPGSSISHFSESATQQQDALMTPFIARGEAIHNPGLLTLSVLADLGWINTIIEHTPVNDTEDNIVSVEIDMGVVSDTLLKKDGLRLIYKYNDNVDYDTLTMISQVTPGHYRQSIDVPSYNTLTSYYMAVSDTFGRVYYSPAGGRKNPYAFFVGADTVKPVINHKPAGFILSILNELKIDAVITDNLYPVNAVVEYKFNSGEPETEPMFTEDSFNYSASISLSDVVWSGSDTVYYRIVATDGAITPNLKTSPTSGYFKLPVYDLYETVDYYFNSFAQGGVGDFLVDGFSVMKPADFQNPALHTIHPYESLEEPGESIEYFAILRHPVAIDESGLLITYKEIVLVEPGESGAQYGSEDFYDYVIVEASKNGGETWFPLISGYDSSDDSDWLNMYNSAIVDNNSTSLGSSDLFKTRRIELEDSPLIGDGDTIVIRFRLFSDPYANGWGWAIDDLFIKAIASSVEKIKEKPANIYPNPGSGLFTLEFTEEPKRGGNSIIITNNSGRVVRGFNGLTDRVIQIDIGDLPSGFYTIIIDKPGFRSSMKYIIAR